MIAVFKGDHYGCAQMRRQCAELTMLLKPTRTNTDANSKTDANKGQDPNGLTRPQGNRGHELVRAIVARPSVADPTSEIKRGCFGDQHHAAATRAFGSAELLG